VPPSLQRPTIEVENANDAHPFFGFGFAKAPSAASKVSGDQASAAQASGAQALGTQALGTQTTSTQVPNTISLVQSTSSAWCCQLPTAHCQLTSYFLLPIKKVRCRVCFGFFFILVG
jgi:hypothetical protein